MSGNGNDNKSALQILLSQAFYTPIELAAILRVSRITVYLRLKSGEIPGKKTSDGWRTSRDDLINHLEKKYGSS